jgi:DNA-binding transcriptional ArsR family regulator
MRRLDNYLAYRLNNTALTTGKPLAKRPHTGRGDAYEELFIALAHPARRLILMTLNFEGGEMCAGRIAALFQHAWPTTTRHLRVLETARLVRHERRGRERVYVIEKERLELARDWLAWFFKKTG